MVSSTMAGVDLPPRPPSSSPPAYRREPRHLPLTTHAARTPHPLPRPSRRSTVHRRHHAAPATPPRRPEQRRTTPPPPSASQRPSLPRPTLCFARSPPEARLRRWKVNTPSSSSSPFGSPFPSSRATPAVPPLPPVAPHCARPQHPLPRARSSSSPVNTKDIVVFLLQQPLPPSRSVVPLQRRHCQPRLAVLFLGRASSSSEDLRNATPRRQPEGRRCRLPPTVDPAKPKYSPSSFASSSTLKIAGAGSSLPGPSSSCSCLLWCTPAFPGTGINTLVLGKGIFPA